MWSSQCEGVVGYPSCLVVYFSLWPGVRVGWRVVSIGVCDHLTGGLLEIGFLLVEKVELRNAGVGNREIAIQSGTYLVKYFTQTVKRAVDKLWAICGTFPQVEKLLCAVCERRFPIKDSLGCGENFVLLNLFCITSPTIPKQSEGNLWATIAE